MDVSEVKVKGRRLRVDRDTQCVCQIKDIRDGAARQEEQRKTQRR